MEIRKIKNSPNWPCVEFFYSRYEVVKDMVQSASDEYGDTVIAWLYGISNSEPLTIDGETWTVKSGSQPITHYCITKHHDRYCCDE